MNDTATIGHNAAPSDADPLKDRLAEDYATLITRKDELMAALDRVPESIDDEETAGKVSDFVVQLKAAAKNANKCRVDEKEVFLSGGRTVDGYFKNISDPLTGAAKNIEGGILTTYQRAKAAEERRVREEQERKAREEQAEADRKAKEAAEAMEDEAGLNTAVENEKAAIQASKDAEDARRLAAKNAADLSRTRSESGTVSSLRTFWDFSNLNRDTLDLGALRHHLPEDALDKAVRSFIKAGGRELKGVDIFENTKTVVR